MDAIYVLNYVTNRELSKRKGKLYMCFVDSKAAFDWVKRDELQKRMEDKNIGENLRKRVMERKKPGI